MSNYKIVNYGIIMPRTPRTTFASPELDSIQNEKAELERALELINIQNEKDELERAFELINIQNEKAELERAFELINIQNEKAELLKELAKRTIVNSTPPLDYESDSDVEDDETSKPQTIIDKVVENNQQKIDIIISLEKLYAKKGWLIPIGMKMLSLNKLTKLYRKFNTV